MNAYAFQAALYCEPCALRLRERLTVSRVAGDWRNESGDSDQWPQGPYPNGGGEADSPQHCDHCRTFLENPLTGDGQRYVCEQLDASADLEPGDSEYTLATRIAAKLRETDPDSVLAQWAEFYPEALEEITR